MRRRQLRPDEWRRLEQRATRVVDRLLAELPADLAQLAAQCAISLEQSPDASDLADGLDPDLLGLFDDALACDHPLFPPPRIRLWLANLWDFAGRNPRTFDAELGHFLGLDEEQLDQRGLL